MTPEAQQIAIACLHARQIADYLNRPELEDNLEDMVVKGRSALGDKSSSRLHPESLPRGEAHRNAKLSEENIRDIRSKYVPRAYSLSKVAAEFGVNRTIIHDVVTRATWRHVA